MLERENGVLEGVLVALAANDVVAKTKRINEKIIHRCMFFCVDLFFIFFFRIFKFSNFLIKILLITTKIIFFSNKKTEKVGNLKIRKVFLLCATSDRKWKRVHKTSDSVCIVAV